MPKYKLVSVTSFVLTAVKDCNVSCKVDKKKKQVQRKNKYIKSYCCKALEIPSIKN